MTTGEKLKKFGVNKFGSVNLFAEAIGMKAPGLYDYFNDKSVPGGEILKKLLKMGCDINWLLGIDQIEAKGKSRYSRNIPILGTIPAGKGADYNQHDWPEYFSLDFDPSTHFCLKVDEENGLSMMPVIVPGDVVLCNRNPKLIKDGSIVAVRYEETKAAIKKIQIQEEFKGGPLLLVSANPAVVPMVILRKNVNEIYKVVAIFKK